MKKPRWKILASLAAGVVVAVLAATPLMAADSAAAGQKGPVAHFLECLKIVNLSDAQKGQIKAILESAKPTLQGLHQQVETDIEALKTALGTSSPDPCAVGAALLKVHADRVAIVDEFKAIKTSIEAVLTPEQIAKLEGCLQAPRSTQPASGQDEGDTGDGF